MGTEAERLVPVLESGKVDSELAAAAAPSAEAPSEEYEEWEIAPSEQA